MGKECHIPVPADVGLSRSVRVKNSDWNDIRIRQLRRLEMGGIEPGLHDAMSRGAFRENDGSSSISDNGCKLCIDHGNLPPVTPSDEYRALRFGECAKERPIRHFIFGEKGHRRDAGERDDIRPGDMVGDDQICLVVSRKSLWTDVHAYDPAHYSAERSLSRA